MKHRNTSNLPKDLESLQLKIQLHMEVEKSFQKHLKIGI